MKRKDEKTKLIVLRELPNNQVQILLESGSGDKEKPWKQELKLAVPNRKRSKSAPINSSPRKKVKIVVETKFRLIEAASGIDTISVIEKALHPDYEFGQPCIFAGSSKEFLIVGDCVNGMLVQAAHGFSWIDFEQVLKGFIKLEGTDLEDLNLSWSNIYHNLGFHRLEDTIEEVEMSLEKEKLSESSSDGVESRNGLKRSQDSLKPVLVFRFGSRGNVEILMERIQKQHNRLFLPSCTEIKVSNIQKSLGIMLDDRTPIVKKRQHNGGNGSPDVPIAICRADRLTDGYQSLPLHHLGRAFVWKDVDGLMDFVTRGRLTKFASTDRLEMSSFLILQDLHDHFGGSEGWKKIWKALDLCPRTPCTHQFESRYSHQYHDHGHLGHSHVPHHIILPHQHNHNHGLGKQYLTAVWHGTNDHLMASKSLYKLKVKPNLKDWSNRKRMTSSGSSSSDGERPKNLRWKVEITEDILNLIMDMGLDDKRILICSMINLESPTILVRSGMESLNSEMIRRTNLMLALESIKNDSQHNVYHVKNLSVERSDKSSGYDFKGSLRDSMMLGVAVIGQFDEIERHHGRLTEKFMDELIAKFCSAFSIATENEYEVVIVSIGQHEWEGLHTNCVLEAISKAVDVVLRESNLDLILALDSCFDQYDRECVTKRLNRL